MSEDTLDRELRGERLAEWAKALRSGDYEQTTEMLGEDQDQGFGRYYCCLGVACIVALGHDEADKVIDWGQADAPSYVNEYFGVDINTFDIQQPVGDGPSTEVMPAGANDDLGWNFDMIADGIDEALDAGRY